MSVQRWTKATKLAVLIVGIGLTCMSAMADGTAVTWPGPANLGYPLFVNYYASRSHVVTVENPGPDTLKITSIIPVEDNYASEAWLSVTPAALTIPPSTTDSITITITGTPFFTPGTNWWLNGRVVLHAPDNAAESVDVDIVNYVIADTVVGIVWDTLQTLCTRLIVSSNGDMGKMGLGGYNLDYVGLGNDCSTTPTDDDVYLFSGGPMVIRTTGADSYVFSSALYQADQWSTQSFKNIEGTFPSSTGTVDYDRFYTGNMVNRDTTIALSRTYYAPKSGNCNFIIAETKYWAKSGPSIPNVMISEVVDWDVPADSGSQNVSGVSLKGFVYQRGTDTAANCPDSSRFAAVALLGYFRKSESTFDYCVNHSDPFGAYAQLTDSVLKYDTAAENIEAGYFWNKDTIGTITQLHPSVQKDQHSVLTVLRNTTLSPTDTLMVYTVLSSVKQGTRDDLEANVTAAKWWYGQMLRPGCSCAACCVGTVGNCDGDGLDIVDVGDLTALIDNLFINFTPLSCQSEGNCDGSLDGIVDIGDLTALIDHLFISFPQLPSTGCGC